MILIPLWMMFAITGGAFVLLAGGALFLQWLVELARNTAYDTGTLAYVSVSTVLRHAADSGTQAATKAKGADAAATKSVSAQTHDAEALFDEMKKAECHLGQLRRMADGLSKARKCLGTAAVILCTTAGLVALITAPK